MGGEVILFVKLLGYCHESMDQFIKIRDNIAMSVLNYF